MGSHGYNSSHDELYENSVFTAEMSSKMQVPKRISVLGGTDDEDKIGQGNFNSRYTPQTDSKYEMKVPDRILLMGQDQHVGMKAPPHELMLENSILSMNNFPPIRVRTPPRSITVDAVSNNHDQVQFEESDEEDNLTDSEINTNEIVLVADKNNSSIIMEPPQLTLTASQLTEEVFVLRQQIGRLHRRMAGFEREQQQRQQRDALAVSIGAVYLVWKVILWLTRS
uniref:Mitochondrial fission factor n=1 Tax=Ceriodaphnia reticulata TaxID=302197 RepID=A0A4Y7M016_9CRUS|nr:EOG090X08OG [Ceriodaphnia reticulata]SVE73023.1 EOG090X08OG [Ceriodaphnia reticulata]